MPALVRCASNLGGVLSTTISLFLILSFPGDEYLTTWSSVLPAQSPPYPEFRTASRLDVSLKYSTLAFRKERKPRPYKTKAKQTTRALNEMEGASQRQIPLEILQLLPAASTSICLDPCLPSNRLLFSRSVLSDSL